MKSKEYEKDCSNPAAVYKNWTGSLERILGRSSDQTQRNYARAMEALLEPTTQRLARAKENSIERRTQALRSVTRLTLERRNYCSSEERTNSLERRKARSSEEKLARAKNAQLQVQIKHYLSLERTTPRSSEEPKTCTTTLGF